MLDTIGHAVGLRRSFGFGTHVVDRADTQFAEGFHIAAPELAEPGGAVEKPGPYACAVTGHASAQVAQVRTDAIGMLLPGAADGTPGGGCDMSVSLAVEMDRRRGGARQGRSVAAPAPLALHHEPC